MLLAISLIAAGCGSSGDSTSPGAASGSQEAEPSPVELEDSLVVQAETICKQGGREIDRLARNLSQEIASSPSRDVIGEVLVEPGIRILNRQSSRLGELTEASDSPQFVTYVGLFEPVLELAELRLEAGRAEEPERGQALERLISDLEDEQSALAKELGLDACGVRFVEALGG